MKSVGTQTIFSKNRKIAPEFFLLSAKWHFSKPLPFEKCPKDNEKER